MSTWWKATVLPVSSSTRFKLAGFSCTSTRPVHRKRWRYRYLIIEELSRRHITQFDLNFQPDVSEKRRRPAIWEIVIFDWLFDTFFERPANKKLHQIVLYARTIDWRGFQRCHVIDHDNVDVSFQQPDDRVRSDVAASARYQDNGVSLSS